MSYQEHDKCRGCGVAIWGLTTKGPAPSSYSIVHNEANCLASRLEERSIVEAKLLEQLAVADAYSTRLEKQLEEQGCRLGVYKTALEQIVRRDYTGASYVALEALRDAERVVERQEKN